MFQGGGEFRRSQRTGHKRETISRLLGSDTIPIRALPDLPIRGAKLGNHRILGIA
jgi:hypothetical protein